MGNSDLYGGWSYDGDPRAPWNQPDEEYSWSEYDREYDEYDDYAFKEMERDFYYVFDYEKGCLRNGYEI